MTFLGTSASFPAAGGACAGLLVQSSTTNVLLDCGTGVMSQLQHHIDPRELDAIFISHFHPDHFLDLIPLRYGLRYGLQPADHRIPLWVHPGGKAYLAGIGVAMRGNEAMFDDCYDIAEYDPQHMLQVGDISISFCRTTHDIPTYAMRLECEGQVTVYGADTRWSDELATFSTGADALVLEATYPESIGSHHTSNHLTARQAGELAREAAPQRLIITHFWPGVDHGLYQSEAEHAFGQSVTLAQPGLCVEL